MKLQDMNLHGELVSSTNKSIEAQFKHIPLTIWYEDDVILFGPAHTSYVKELSITDSILTAVTRNSTYVWKLTNPTPDRVFSIPNRDKMEANLQNKGL